MPIVKPIIFLTVSFSLKAKTEPIHTNIIPKPLNNGNKSTDGTLPERLVITKLIIQRDNALPSAQTQTSNLFFFSSQASFLSLRKQEIIRKGTTNE